MSREQTVDIIFPNNQDFYQSYSLNLTREGLRTVGDLKKSIARRLYLQPACITIKHEQSLLDDNNLPLSNVDLHNYKEVVAFVAEPTENTMPNVKPLIIEGLDFTNVKIVQEMFGMKFEESRPLPTTSQTNNSSSRNNNNSSQREDRGEIDFKTKYRSQLAQLKTQLQELGIQNTEDDLLIQLVNTKGNVPRAMETILDQGL